MMIDRIAPAGLTTGTASLAARSAPRMPSDDRPRDLWWTDGGAIEYTTEAAARAALGRYIQPQHACCETCRAIQRSADQRGT